MIYSNSVLGARSNFDGGPWALAAALTKLIRTGDELRVDPAAGTVEILNR